MKSYPYRNSSTILSLITSIPDNIFNITIWDNAIEEISEEENGPTLITIILLIFILLIFASGVTGGILNFKVYSKKLDK